MLRVFLFGEKHLAAPADPGQRVADLMSHVRRHLSYRSQPLSLDEALSQACAGTKSCQD